MDRYHDFRAFSALFGFFRLNFSSTTPRLAFGKDLEPSTSGSFFQIYPAEAQVTPHVSCNRSVAKGLTSPPASPEMTPEKTGASLRFVYKHTQPEPQTEQTQNTMKGFILVSLLVCSEMSASAEALSRMALPRSTPEKQGISSSAILEFVDAADRTIDSLHSFMLVRHGHVVAEGWWAPYARELPHSMYSLSKSFTSTAVGLAISEGKLSLDDEVLRFFPGDAPADPSANLKAMRVRDLLIMSAGHHQEDLDRFSFETNVPLTKLFLSLPVAHKPGTAFLYNTPGSYMLSAIVQKVTGMTVLDYLKPRLFAPLGIEHPTWEMSRQGISLGGYGLSIQTEDIAHFGQLYLQKGVWNGKQLLPAEWVVAATARQTSNGSNPSSDWDQGYGYQFWRCRHGLYRGDGAFGQFCIVMPEQDAVVAITSGTKDMQGVMNLIWDHLLPAMGPKRLKSDPTALERLKSRLAGLALRPQQGSASPGSAAQAANRQFSFPTNALHVESLALGFINGGGPATLTLRSNGSDYPVTCGNREWLKGRLRFGNFPEGPVAASGAWTADGVYTAKICFNETPYVVTISLQFNGQEVAFDSEYNVALRGPTKQPRLIGHSQ